MVREQWYADLGLLLESFGGEYLEHMKCPTACKVENVMARKITWKLRNY
jgi:hypothetical protein